MTRRSLILALLAAAALAAATFFNDQVMKGTYLIGFFLPVAVTGLLLVFSLAVNPLLARARPAWALGGRELAALLALLFFACHVPGRGLMHFFSSLLVMPWRHERTNPGWQGEPARLQPEQVRDWSALARALGRGDAGDAEDGVLARLRARLPAGLRERLRDASAGPDGAWRAEALDAVNAALADGRLLDPRPAPAAGLDPATRLLAARPPGALDPDARARLARGLLDAALPEAIAPRRPGVLELVPPRMLADPAAGGGHAVDGFATGLAIGDRRLRPGDVPWAAWTRTLGFWVPLILTLGVAATALALVLHRQWSSHEHLPYPIAEFARAVLPEEEAREPGLLRNRLFWAGTGVVFAIHALNYANAWWPEFAIPVRIQLDLQPLLDLFPVYREASWPPIFTPTLYFTVIGFAYFLASDVSLSLGAVPYVYVLAAGYAARYGVVLGGGQMRPSIEMFLHAGGTAGLFAAVAYAGRHYYGTVFGRALGLRRAGPAPEPHAVWGARVFLAAFALFVAQIAAVGVDPWLAVPYAAALFMVYVVMSRLVAEAGTFFVNLNVYPCAVLWGLMGAGAVGQQQLLLLGLVSMVVVFSPRESLMPFAVNALRLWDGARVPLGRSAAWGVAVVALTLAVAWPLSLYLQYQHGAVRAGDGWATGSVPRLVPGFSAEIRRTLEAQGAVRLSESLAGPARFARATAAPSCAGAFAFAFGGALLFTFLRHRLPRWPVHPLVFVWLGSYQSKHFGFSFLLGWLAKSLVSRYGGAAAYRRLKPLAVGLVAGEILAATAPVVVGALYYAATRTPPVPFRILPG